MDNTKKRKRVCGRVRLLKPWIGIKKFAHKEIDQDFSVFFSVYFTPFPQRPREKKIPRKTFFSFLRFRVKQTYSF